MTTQGMTAAEKIRAKAARAKQHQEQAEPESSRPVSSAAAPHVKPIRSTVDLLPVKHASFKAWCGETAVMIGRARVTTQDVIRALVDRLLTDETLARKIRDDLHKQ